MNLSLYSRHLVSLLLCCFPLLAYGQSTLTLSGQVVDPEGGPLVAANAVLLYKDSGKMASGTTTDAEGNFSLKQLAVGDYLLQISYISYKSYQQSISLKKSEKLPPITLEEDSEMIGTVVVHGKATEVTVKGDTLLFNASAYKVSEGEMLEDLVKRLPGAEIDKAGKITINGQTIDRIMLDGKEFFNSDTKVVSKNLPAQIVEQLELLSRKSDESRMTGFDDNEEEMVLNIRTRMGDKQGTFGNAFVGYGTDKRYELNGMVNQFNNELQYSLIAAGNNTNNQGFSDIDLGDTDMINGALIRQGRGNYGGEQLGITTSWNLGSNVNYMPGDFLETNANVRYGQSENLLEVKSETENLIPDAANTFTHEESITTNLHRNVGGDMMLRWRPSERTEIVIRPTASYSWGNVQSQMTHATVDAEEDLINSGNQESYGSDRAFVSRSNIQVSHRFNDLGRTLSGRVRLGARNSSSEIQSISSLMSQGGGESLSSMQDKKSDQLDYSIRLNYVEPLTKNIFLQGQVEWGQKLRTSERLFFTPDALGRYTMQEASKSSTMSNELNTWSLGADAKYKNQKLDLTVGLRVKPTTMISKQSELLSGAPIKIQGEIWAPSFNLRYNPNRQNSLRLNYWVYEDMPSAEQMYAVADPTNLRERIMGNPDLRPIQTHECFARYRGFFSSGGQAINLHFYGSYRKYDIISRMTVDPLTNLRYTTYDNSNRGTYNFRLDGNFSTPLFGRRLTLSLRANAAHMYGLGYINDLINETYTWRTGGEMTLVYSNEWLYVRSNLGLMRMSNQYTQQQNLSATTYDWRAGGDVSLTLPWGFKLESEAVYTRGVGYSNGYNLQFVDWSAALSYSFLKDKTATIRLKVYDILNMSNTIDRLVSATEITDRYTNSLGRYGMIHFIYRFSAFSSGSTARDMRSAGDRHFH